MVNNPKLINKFINNINKLDDETIKEAIREVEKVDMEEDIKILESYTTDLFHSYKEGVIIKAIRNLLKRYKELEEENKELELEKESYKHDYFDIYERTKRYIKEDDVIELQEKIHKDLDKNGITRAYQIIIDKYFNKLLGEY